MRIGTWNLEGPWDSRPLALIQDMDCDVLLLTEVREDVAIPGFNVHTDQPRTSIRSLALRSATAAEG